MEKNFDKEKAMKGLSIIPFVLFILFSVVFFAVGIMGFIYSIVTYLAFESPMVFLILFGCFVLFTGIGILLIDCFIRYKKKYDSKYNPTCEEDNEPTTTTIVAKKKFKLDFQTICYGVMIVGAVFVLISAGLGSISPDSWRNETGDYLTSKGYNGVAKLYDLSYHKPIEKITLDLDTKNVVVIYTDDDYVMIRGYETFPGQITSAYGNGTLKITDNTAPSLEGDTVAKMLFFLFKENEAESQIRLFIPLSQKDNITIEGEYIVAQE